MKKDKDKQKAETVEISIRLEECQKGRLYCEAYMVSIGAYKIESIYTDAEATVSKWIRYTHRLHHLRHSGTAPLIVGLSGYHSRPFRMYGHGEERRRLCLLSLCVPGNRCLLVPTNYYYCGHVPHPLRAFFADRNVLFMGMEARSIARELGQEWGVHLESAFHLRQVVERSFGREAVEAAAAGKGMGAVGLEELAKVAMDGIEVQRKPGRLESNGWGGWAESPEEAMYATADAFMACEIAWRCYEIRGGSRPG